MRETNSVRLQLKVKTSDYKFLWLKSVSGFDASVHCARCLIGNYHKALPFGRAPAGLEIDVTLDDAPFWYLCGVTSQWGRNLHVAMRPIPTQTLEIIDTPDIRLEVQGAEILTIPPIAPGVFPPGVVIPVDYETCRNYQFGIHYLHLNAPLSNDTVRKIMGPHETRRVVRPRRQGAQT